MSDSEADTPIHLQGRILLADPSLHDGIFDRSVVLLADHSADEGAFGLILNHPTGQPAPRPGAVGRDPALNVALPPGSRRGTRRTAGQLTTP